MITPVQRTIVFLRSLGYSPCAPFRTRGGKLATTMPARSKPGIVFLVLESDGSYHRQELRVRNYPNGGND